MKISAAHAQHGRYKVGGWEGMAAQSRVMVPLSAVPTAQIRAAHPITGPETL